MRKLEVCAGSIESIKAAYEGGAYRVELCSALSEDGLTPSVGMIRYAKSLGGLKVNVLIRPRGGDFVYTEEEVQCMDNRFLREEIESLSTIKANFKLTSVNEALKYWLFAAPSFKS